MIHARVSLLAAASAALVLLSACQQGGGGAPAKPTEPAKPAAQATAPAAAAKPTEAAKPAAEATKPAAAATTAPAKPTEAAKPAAGAATSAPAAKPAGEAQAITVKGLDTLKFDPAEITVKAGVPVKLTLQSTGALVHDWTIKDLDGKQVQVIAEGGKSNSVEFTPQKAGTYQFVCTQPGHTEAGMVGKLIVQ